MEDNKLSAFKQPLFNDLKAQYAACSFDFSTK